MKSTPIQLMFWWMKAVISLSMSRCHCSEEYLAAKSLVEGGKSQIRFAAEVGNEMLELDGMNVIAEREEHDEAHVLPMRTVRFRKCFAIFVTVQESIVPIMLAVMVVVGVFSHGEGDTREQEKEATQVEMETHVVV